MSELLVERDGPVAILTLNRPERLNAISGPMLAALSESLVECDRDPGVRAIILTGAGRGFCAGLDLQDAASGAGIGGGGGGGLGVTLDLRDAPPVVLHRIDTPTICALNGGAAGYGMDLALGCDIRIAAEQAKLAAAFTKRGVLPESGGTWLLPRLVGRSRAIGLAMSGDKLGAEEAQRIGLIWQCVDDAALIDTALALATKLAAMPTRALADTRRALDDAMQLGYADALALEARMQRELGRGHDYAEGVAAFIAKRAPVFTDR